MQKDEHFLQWVRYVERNAKRAGLVKQAEKWRWSSLYHREHNTKQQHLLSVWPVKPDHDYLKWVNEPQPKEEIEVIRHHIQRGRPYGQETWMQRTAEQLGLESTFRNRGKPW